MLTRSWGSSPSTVLGDTGWIACPSWASVVSSVKWGHGAFASAHRPRVPSAVTHGRQCEFPHLPSLPSLSSRVALRVSVAMVPSVLLPGSVGFGVAEGAPPEQEGAL